MHLNSKDGGEEEGVCMGEFGGVEGMIAIFGEYVFSRVLLLALSQL